MQMMETTTVIVPAMAKNLGDVNPNAQIRMFSINPSGLPLIVDSLRSLDTTHVSTIIIALPKPLIQENFWSTLDFEYLFYPLTAQKRQKLRFHYLSTPALDAVYTIIRVISDCSVTGPIFIKDLTSNFSHLAHAGNYLTYLNLDPAPRGEYSARQINGHIRGPDPDDIALKSHVTFTSTNTIDTLSSSASSPSHPCSGGWSFLSAADFLASAHELWRNTCIADSGVDGDGGVNGARSSAEIGGPAEESRARGQRGALGVQGVMGYMICEGHVFVGEMVSEFEDWAGEMA